MVFSEAEKKRSRLTLEGLREHWFELQRNQQRAEQSQQAKGEPLAARLEKYHGYREIPLK